MSANELYDPKNLDKYTYEHTNVAWFRQFLWFCAGTDKQLLERCPHSDRVKMEGLGGIVLATAILALISGFTAAEVILQRTSYVHIWAAIVAIVWAVIIFNLDRFIVTSTGHGDGTEKITGAEWKGLIPRLTLALAIGASLSAPLEITIMHQEIEAELKNRQDASFDVRYKEAAMYSAADTAKFRAQKEEATKTLENKATLFESRKQGIIKQRHDIDEESAGKTANQKRGCGDACKTKLANLDALESGLVNEKTEFESKKKELEASVKQAEIEIRNRELELENKKIDIRKRVEAEDGISKRIQIAHDLAPNVALFLFFLLLMLETTPVLIKSMLIRGPYDLLTDNQKKIVAARFAVEERSVSKGENSGKLEEQIEPSFHQAITIEKFEVGKLAVEASLAETAQEVFKNKTSQDIQANPDKYIKDDPSKA